MNIEKLKYNFKTLYPKSMIVLYCILVPISLLLSTSHLFSFLFSLPMSIPIITIMRITESILALIGAVIILMSLIAGWVFTFNIEKKINYSIKKKYEESWLYFLYMGGCIIIFSYLIFFSDFIYQIIIIINDMAISLNLYIFIYIILIILGHFVSVCFAKLHLICNMPIYFWMLFSNRLG